MVHNVVPDRMHQVGFAQADAPVQKQRVVSFRRRFGNRERGRMRELVIGSDYKCIKCIFRVKHMGMRFLVDDRRLHCSRREHHCRLGSLRFLNRESHIYLPAQKLEQRRPDKLCIAALQPFGRKCCRRSYLKHRIIYKRSLRCFKPGVKARFA